MCRIFKFLEVGRRTAARQASAPCKKPQRPAAVSKNKNDRMAKGHAVIGRYRIVRQKVSIFALAGALLLYPSRAFFDNLYSKVGSPAHKPSPLCKSADRIAWYPQTPKKAQIQRKNIVVYQIVIELTA